MSFLIWLFLIVFHVVIGSELSTDICTSNGNVICIGLGTYGQSLCKQAIANNLTVIAAFKMDSTPSQTLSEYLTLPPASNQHCALSKTDMPILHISKLAQFLSTNEQSATALIGITDSLNTFSNILPTIKQCLSHSMNVITILTPQLLNNENIDILKDLHKLATAKNVFFKAAGLASYLMQIFPADIMQNDDIKKDEIILRMECNADYIAWIHRNERPNVWNDWFIGQRVESYHSAATSLNFYKMLKNELNVFGHLLLKKYDKMYTFDDWMYTFNSKAIYDQHGETLSAYLRRQIETGRITQIRYHGRLSHLDEEKSVSMVIKMGLFKDKKERDLLTPCRIEWEFLNEAGKEMEKKEIMNVDIVAAMMYDAIKNLVDIKYQNNCGVCCDEDLEIQKQCIQQMSDIKQEL